MAYTTIDNPELYFQVLTWSGNDSGTSRSFTLDGDEDMQPDLVWTKIRAGWGAKHNLWDSVRGVNKNISSDSNAAETTTDVYGYVSSFDSDGFTGTNGASGGNPRYLYNESGGTYVAWCWKAGTTSGISGSPSITPAGYSFNADSGFSIVKWTGTGANATIPHGLGTASIGMVIIKNLDGGNWAVYHHKNTSAPETDYLKLSTTAATVDDNTWWNDTAPTSTLVNLGSYDEVNKNTENMVAYIFAEKQGYSKFGSYTGNNNADGTFVYTGFRPAYVMTKITSGTDGWMIFDNKRNTYNVMDKYMTADGVGADSTRDTVDFLSNGFKWRIANGDCNNGTYVYMAFAEAPFVNSNGVPCNAR